MNIDINKKILYFYAIFTFNKLLELELQKLKNLYDTYRYRTNEII